MVFGVRVDAQLAVDRGAEILDRQRPVDRFRAHRVRGPDHLSTGNTGSGDRDGEDARPVIATRRVIDFRRPAELADGQHQRCVQQSPGIHVFKQGREGLIEFRIELLVGRVVVAVGVVAAVEHRDEPHAGFDQPPRQQRPLPAGRATVGVAETVGFRADVERPLGLRRTD